MKFDRSVSQSPSRTGRLPFSSLMAAAAIACSGTNDAPGLDTDVGSGGRTSKDGSFNGGAASTGGSGGAVSSTGGVTNGGGGASSGGGGTGGVGTGGQANGGASAGGNSGGASTGGSGGGGTGGTPGQSYPCDGTTTGYDVVVTLSGGTWTTTRDGNTVNTATGMYDAMTAALNALTAGRTVKQSILVQGSGDIPATQRVSLPSYTILNICGTINVTGAGSGDYAPIYARGRTDIDIPNVKITGTPVYGMFFRDVDNLHLGQVDLRLGTGLGVRIDNNAGTVKRQNVYGQGTSSHVVETYGIDKIKIGTVEGLDVGESGLLLNNTTNAEVGLVTCNNCGSGTGYAAFRIANDAGKIGNDWPAGNIHVGKVYARGGGRGIFSVSGSGGLTIDQIDIADTGNNAILLQNCYNTTIAALSGTVSTGTVLLSNDTTNTNSGLFAASSNVTLQNLALSNGATVSEAWCQLGDRGNRARNITGGTVSMCFGN